MRFCQASLFIIEDEHNRLVVILVIYLFTGEAMLEGVVLLASTMRPGAVMDFSSPAVIMLAAFLACLVLLIVGISIFIFGNSKDDPE